MTETKKAAATATESRGRQTKVGRVVSNKMQKTIVVQVERRVQHAEYTRTIKRTSKFHAHDEKNEAKIGDRVRIEETRPMSKLKRWRLREILTRAEA
ncbi:MAG TPA: 30S ribosomal protein S17 [Thermoanaerobaculia bacterium]|jgi:small subunit ribosomal protein S17